MYGNMIFGAVLAIGTTVALLYVIHKLASPARGEVVSAEWLSRFSVSKYRPMERLLSLNDMRFLSEQKGYRPKIGRRLRMERIRSYRGYLKCLRADYRKLEAAISLWMAGSPKDRPELAMGLLKSRLKFQVGMAHAQWRVILFWLNIAPARQVQLVEGLDDLRICLRRVALVRQASLS